MYALETKELTKVFNNYKAVDALSLKVPEGSVYGFLGPNGAGKTTTIKMITGLSKPTEGEIKIFGKDVKYGSLINRTQIGFLPDVPNYYDWMNASEFLKFSGNLFNINKSILNARIEELLEMVGLGGVKKKIKGYSRGMKQRLGIAQALVNEPKVVFLDEPTSALDPIGRKEVLEIIGKLAGKTTVFFSTHILTDVERICDRVVILNKGKMMMEDSIENLKQKYSTHSILLDIGHSSKNDMMDLLKTMKWVRNINHEDNGGINLVVSDLDIAEKEIPKIISDKGFNLKKFLLQEPSLEDIFLKVVNE